MDGKTVEEVIRSGFYKFSESIDISGFEIKPQELSGLLARVLKDDPYLFFVDGQMSIICTLNWYKPFYNASSKKIAGDFV